MNHNKPKPPTASCNMSFIFAFVFYPATDIQGRYVHGERCSWGKRKKGGDANFGLNASGFRSAWTGGMKRFLRGFVGVLVPSFRPSGGGKRRENAHMQRTNNYGKANANFENWKHAASHVIKTITTQWTGPLGASSQYQPTTAFMLSDSRNPDKSSFLTSTTQCSKLSMRTRAFVSSTTS